MNWFGQKEQAKSRVNQQSDSGRMTCCVLRWDFAGNTEEGPAKTLSLFSKWQPGPAVFQGFYGFADGNGGFAIVEAADACTHAGIVDAMADLRDTADLACAGVGCHRRGGYGLAPGELVDHRGRVRTL